MSKPNFIAVEEQDREYIYEGGDILPIGKITEIAVSKSGHHRLTTAVEDEKYIVAPGWRAIKLKAKKWSF